MWETPLLTNATGTMVTEEKPSVDWCAKDGGEMYTVLEGSLQNGRCANIQGVLGYHWRQAREASQAEETLPRKEAGHSLGLNSHGLCAYVFSVFDGRFQALESTMEGI